MAATAAQGSAEPEQQFWKDVSAVCGKLGQDLQCPICMDVMLDPAQLPCCHFYCWECICKAEKKFQIKCPLCKAVCKKRDVSRSDLIRDIRSHYLALDALCTAAQTGANAGAAPSPLGAEVAHAEVQVHVNTAATGQAKATVAAPKGKDGAEVMPVSSRLRGRGGFTLPRQRGARALTPDAQHTEAPVPRAASEEPAAPPAADTGPPANLDAGADDGHPADGAAEPERGAQSDPPPRKTRTAAGKRAAAAKDAPPAAAAAPAAKRGKGSLVDTTTPAPPPKHKRAPAAPHSDPNTPHVPPTGAAEEDPDAGGDMEAEVAAPAGAAAAAGAAGAVTSPEACLGTMIVVDDTPGGQGVVRRVPLRHAPWICAACTLHNVFSARKCAACRTVRPRNAAVVTPASLGADAPTGTHSAPQTAVKPSQAGPSRRGKQAPAFSPPEHATPANNDADIAKGGPATAPKSAPTGPFSGKRSRLQAALPASAGVDNVKRAARATPEPTPGAATAAAASPAQPVIAEPGQPQDVPGHDTARPATQDKKAATVTKSQAWPGASKWVLLGSGLDKNELVSLRRLASRAGCELVQEWSASVTHVVCGVDPSGCARRTFKYLMGIAHGCWVLSTEWVHTCMREGEPAEPDAYQVLGDHTAKTGGPAAGRVSKEQGFKVLAGYELLFAGPFSMKEDMMALCKAAGGTILHRPPVIDPPTDTHAADGADGSGATPLRPPRYVLTDPEACKSKKVTPAAAAASAVDAGMTLLSYKWLLDCVGSQRIAPVEPYLNPA